MTVRMMKVIMAVGVKVRNEVKEKRSNSPLIKAKDVFHIIKSCRQELMLSAIVFL